MKRFIAIFASIILAVTLTGCASPSYYQAAATGNSFGYGDRQIDGPLHRINYIASPVASLDQTYAFAIYRAAELAQSKGAAFFEVLEGPINKDAIERFIGKATTANLKAFDSKDLTPLTAPSTFLYDPLGRPYSPIQPARYVQTQTFIYIPIQPPPPPVQISLLIRLLSAPSLDAAKGFDVNDLLARLGPKIPRPPVKTS
jgi:hypothetical protein